MSMRCPVLRVTVVSPATLGGTTETAALCKRWPRVSLPNRSRKIPLRISRGLNLYITIQARLYTCCFNLCTDASHNWWKFLFGISYLYSSWRSTLLGNQCYFLRHAKSGLSKYLGNWILTDCAWFSSNHHSWYPLCRALPIARDVLSSHKRSFSLSSPLLR